MAKTAKAPRLLSIEDDAAMGQFLKAVFTAQGFAMEVASDGNQGLEQARRDRPDLVILDLLMPYKSGFEVLQELKAAPETRGVPVIILSSNSREEDIVRALNAGADDFVVKPFRARELVTRVRKVLERLHPTP
ncbi:MAG TPA: response regulator transcription factor [Gemmatimonadales bacterium]|jgi:DNA-binding response OmpR family regulator|nr:response regulator transcription factor [Gemmatimonadales bacterium]